jgi:hypothetical protein
MKSVRPKSVAVSWLPQPAFILLRLVMARIRRPRPPPMLEYDDFIEALNKSRRKVGLPAVFDIRQAKQNREIARDLERGARRKVKPTTSTASVGEGTYEYVPSDKVRLDEQRGYHP